MPYSYRSFAPPPDQSGPLAPRFAGLWVVEAGSEEPYPLHRHRDFEVIIPERGAYRCQLNQVELRLDPGACLVVKPGDQHRDLLRAGGRHLGVWFRLANTINTTKLFSAAGNQTVRYRIYADNGRSGDTTKTITINATPVASFSVGGAPFCTGKPVTLLSAATGVSNWNWDLGNTTSTAVPSFTHLYNAAGSYTITLTTANAAGCPSFPASQTITISTTPVVNAGTDTVIRVGQFSYAECRNIPCRQLYVYLVPFSVPQFGFGIKSCFRGADLDFDGPLFASGAAFVVCPEDAPELPVPTVRAGIGEVDFRGVLAQLEVDYVQAEGGSVLNAALAAADVLDELDLTISPVLSGGDGPRLTTGAPPLLHRMRLAHLCEDDAFLFTRYVRVRG